MNNKNEPLHPVEYELIIKRRILCWFREFEHFEPIIGFLEVYTEGANFPFRATNGERYGWCEPVKRDEVGFLEDYR